MKAIILAAGYGTRLYPLTLDQSKPLLMFGSKHLIDHIMTGIDEISDIDKVIVVTNQKFIAQFEEWRSGRSFKKEIILINDGTESNKDRLGAIKDTELSINSQNIKDEDLLVIGGDNLYRFKLKEFTDYSRNKKKCCVAVHDIANIERAKRSGVVTLDKSGRVVDFQEKPSDPKTTLVAICMYYFPKAEIEYLNEYLSTTNIKDAPGHYISWRAKRDKVYGFVFNEDWYDIGDMTSYDEAQDKFSNNK